jgi:hypothetical protein
MRRILVMVVWTVHRWGSKRPHLASRPVVPSAMMTTTGGISGWRARMACQVSSSVVSTRLAVLEYSPGLPTSALGGASRAGPYVAVAVGVVLQVGGQVFVGFDDAPEPIDGPGIGVVAVGVMLAGRVCGRPS